MKDAPWFVAPPSAWADGSVRLSDTDARHAVRVLRIAPPDVITVTDGRGTVARCAVRSVEPDGGVIAEILERDVRRAPRPELALYQGIAKGRKLDEVVDRLGELGVTEMNVFGSTRAVVRWDPAKRDRRVERWEAIAHAAAKQSRSPFVLRVGGGLSWTELVRRVAREPFTVVLWEDASLPLRSALVDGIDRVAMVVGPEGGLAREEADSLADVGAQLVSLGPRILRTEVAPIVAASAILWHYGAIG